ncbi:MAG: cytochrome c3 family protein [Desulfobulbaceae bacterium]
MKKIVLLIIAAALCALFADQACAASKEACFSCHDKSQFSDKIVHDPVRSGECTTCHNPHVARYAGLLRYEGGSLCYSCHEDAAGAFQQGIVHEPINRNQCTVCHTPHTGPEKGLIRKDIKLDCLRCHSSLKDSYRYTHEPYRTGECRACHLPHNSDNSMLLVTTREKICGECHDAADLAGAHKGFPGTLRMCLSCHSPHGSSRKGMVRDFLHEPFKEGCADCHEGGAGSVPVSACIECHPGVMDEMRSTHSHIGGRGNSCVNCHSPHAGDEKRLLIMREKQVCAQCHRPSIDMYKNSPFRHQSIDNCTDCHYPHGGSDMAMLKGNGLEVCALCHEDQGSFTHPVGPDVPDPRTGRMMTCITCHNPMGTNYPDNLILDGKEKLCVQCHTQY